jgi:pyridoxine 5-phosphate synthase
MKLGVNIDHVATLRQARGTSYPDPAMAALLCEQAGCHSIVAHLREDRRHIQDFDLARLKEMISIPFNLEMSINRSIVDVALRIKPEQVTLVPEKRQELTTESGMDLQAHRKEVEKVVGLLKASGIKVSVFIDPLKHQVEFAKKVGADLIELNTGKYSEGKTTVSRQEELQKIHKAAVYAKRIGFFVAAGHGIDYENVFEIAKIREIQELNIGHSIIARSVFSGIVSAVEEMISLFQISHADVDKHNKRKV